MSLRSIQIEGPYTTAERDALATPDLHQIIFNSDNTRLEFWTGAAWQGVLGDNITVDGSLTVTGDVTVTGALGISAGVMTVDDDVTFEERTSFKDRIVSEQKTLAAANDLTLTDGNAFEITGATQINAIATALWIAGSQVTLMFASTPTVKHNTAGGAGTAVILLAGAVDFVATTGDTLTLLYSNIGGTLAWREI